MVTRSLRATLLVASDELLRKAGHVERRVIELGETAHQPACGCGYAGLIVATPAAAVDSLLHHLDDARRRLVGNAAPGTAGNARQRRAKMCNISQRIRPETANSQ